MSFRRFEVIELTCTRCNKEYTLKREYVWDPEHKDYLATYTAEELIYCDECREKMS